MCSLFLTKTGGSLFFAGCSGKLIRTKIVLQIIKKVVCLCRANPIDKINNLTRGFNKLIYSK